MSNPFIQHTVKADKVVFKGDNPSPALSTVDKIENIFLKTVKEEK